MSYITDVYKFGKLADFFAKVFPMDLAIVVPAKAKPKPNKQKDKDKK